MVGSGREETAISDRRLLAVRFLQTAAGLSSIPGMVVRSCCEAGALCNTKPLLDFCGPAKIFFGVRNPPAFPANEFCVFYQFLIIFKAVFKVPHIYQIAQMVIMHGVWHAGLFHIYPLSCFILIEQGTITCPFTDIDTISIRTLQ
jgi:hypothetical protein